jgi:tetratricopeptide (TPR) repeat protein
MSIMRSRSGVLVACAVLASAATIEAAPRPEARTDKVPITTGSEDARALYLKGRTLFENLRATDARKLFEAAVAKDASFALAFVGLANTAQSPRDFFGALEHAVALADKVSEPERLIIRGLDAGAKGQPRQQAALLGQLVQAYPKDERALTLLANFYFGQQDYARSIATFNQVHAIDPSFAPAYNLLGYAYRAVEKYQDAEATFKKYTELIPGDPNPYDSYAELLMKVGRFDESIAGYQKALAIDPNFVASYIGIANDYMFSGRGGDARKTLAKLTQVARSDGERRQALAWTAESFIHEAAWDQALGEIDKMMAIADKTGDLGQRANDQNFRGNTLLEANRPDDAAAAFIAQLEASDKSGLPAEVKAAARRNGLYDQARVALARRDLATAKARNQDYAKQVAAKQIPFEVRQQHELAGMIALADAKPKVAAAELAQANQQDPRVLYLFAVALSGSGDAARARALARKAVEFNGLSLNYGYVRGKAKDLLKS